VVGLQGRFPEAERIVRADLPPAEAEANVAYLREMLAQHDEWKASSRPPTPAPKSKKPQRAKAATPAEPDSGT
jgi:hypothetical protein